MELHAHRTCGSVEYMPSSTFRFLSMLLSTFAFGLRVSSCPRGLHSLPLLRYAGISYAPTRRTLLIQCLARCHPTPSRLSACRMEDIKMSVSAPAQSSPTISLFVSLSPRNPVFDLDDTDGSAPFADSLLAWPTFFMVFLLTIVVFFPISRGDRDVQ